MSDADRCPRCHCLWDSCGRCAFPEPAKTHKLERAEMLRDSSITQAEYFLQRALRAEREAREELARESVRRKQIIGEVEVQLAAMTAERDALRADHTESEKALIDSVIRLSAERDALREALEAIARMPTYTNGAKAIARAALGKKGDGRE